MKKLVLTVLFLCVSGVATYGQTNQNQEIERFRDRLYRTIRYPPVAHENEFNGQVIAEFKVDKNGNFKEIKIVKSLNRWCDTEVVSKLRYSWNNYKLKPKKYKLAVNFIIFRDKDTLNKAALAYVSTRKLLQVNVIVVEPKRKVTIVY